MVGYTTARAHEYLAITGANIDSVRICKKAMVWPAQRCMKFSIQPRDYPMNLRAMTKEKLQFELPVVFTIGPDITMRDEGSSATGPGDGLLKYSMLLASSTTDKGGEEHIENIIKGIIEGETRVLVSAMTLDEIFSGREQFKQRTTVNIQGELNQFGLKIYNANVKELDDAPDSNYFASLRMKAHEGASNQARIDVAEAQWKGNVGEADRRGRQNREIAKINADTAIQNTERETEKATAESTLATRKAALDGQVKIAQIEAVRETEARDEELLKQVEMKRAEKEVERLRATDVVKATILREAQQQAADAKCYEMEAAAKAGLFREQKQADSHAYTNKVHTDAAFLKAARDAEADLNRVTRESEAMFKRSEKEAEANLMRVTKEAEASAIRAEATLVQATKEAEATFIRKAKEAEAFLIQATKEAEGMSKMADAYSKMAQAFGGPHGVLQYLMLDKGVYGELARANATAVQGMQPKITVWNTGSGGKEGDRNDPQAAIRNTYQMLPPLMTTINEQTGISLPEWQFGKLPSQISNNEGNGTKKLIDSTSP